MKHVVTFNESLTNPCKRVSLKGKVEGEDAGQYYIPEGHSIAQELLKVLNRRQDGIGLAANQIGINAKVAVVNVVEPIILINPTNSKGKTFIKQVNFPRISRKIFGSKFTKSFWIQIYEKFLF